MRNTFAAALAAAASLACAADMREMEMRLPLMPRPPVVDGVVGAEEWGAAHGSFGFVRYGNNGDTVEPVGSAFWVGRTADRLFLAGVSRVGPNGILRKFAARRGNVDCTSDDTYEIVLVPDTSKPSPDVRHVIVNFNGAYRIQALLGNSMAAWMPETMETKSTVRDGKWHFEWSVSLGEIGFSDAPADRHAIRFVRNFKQIESQWGYQSSMRPNECGFFAAAKAVPTVFDDDAVAAFLERDCEPGAQQWGLRLRLHNPTAREKAVDAMVEGRPENSQPGSLVRSVVLKPGETVVLPVGGPILGDERVTLAEDVKVDGRRVFFREVRWRPNGPAPQWLKPGDDGGAFRFDFAYYPSHDKMRLRADLSSVQKRPREVAVEMRSDASRGRDVLAATTLALGADGVADVLWDVPDLKAETLRTGVGGYTIKATAAGVKDGVVSREFRRDVFEWEGFAGGTSDAVPSRFEKVRRRAGDRPGDEVVSVVLRDHVVDAKTGLWRQVDAAGKPILARPMSISPLPPGAAVETEWDVDGMMTWRLTLPAGRCAPISLDIPLRAERAPLLHSCADGMRFNYAGAVPPGSGRVWDSSKAPRSSIIGDYVPYVWVGGPLRGIAVFGESDKGWVLDDADGGRIPCQEVVREGDGTVVMRLNLVQKACELESPRTILLGFQATPVKPMEKDWRSSPIGSLIGSCYYWGGYSASDEIHPYDGTDTFWRKMAEARRTGKIDKAYVERAIAERLYHCPTNSPKFASTARCFRAHYYSGMHSMANACGKDEKFVWYTNGRGVRLGNPEGTTFADEWTREAFSARPFEWGATKSYSLDPNRAYLDFAAWWWEKALSLGVVDYLYWDDIFCAANFDLVGTEAYRTPEGDIQPASGIFNQRAQVRRCAVLQREHGWPDGKNWVHMTNTALAPVLSFAGMNYDWEDTAGDMAIQERYSRECILAQSIGRQFGNQVAVMGYFATKDPKSEKLKWLHRTGTGACLAHELQWQRVREWREAHKLLVDWGYRLPSTRVWNYWDEDVPLPVDVKGGVAATLAMAKPGGEALVVVSDFGDGGDYVLVPDVAALGLPRDFAAFDLETGAELAVVDGAVRVRLARLDYVIVALRRRRAAQAEADVVVYGATPAGYAAAIQARRMGRSVVVLEPTGHVGGLTTGGLGQTDIGNKEAFGGIAREFYRDIRRHYMKPSSWRREKMSDYLPDGQCANSQGMDTMWTFEPSAASAVLSEWERQNGLSIVRNARLRRGGGGIVRDGASIAAVRLEDGSVFRGRVFVDATYEGDLMAEAGVSYTVGRESNSTYGETLNGQQPVGHPHHNFDVRVDPYVVPGVPSSGLLPGIDPAPMGRPGEGDRRVQAYCYRMTLTDDPANRIPFERPEGYDEREYELLFRNYEAGERTSPPPWINSRMPNRKTDTNNCRGLSTDFIGRNHAWPEASYAEREAIANSHLVYQKGLMWTLANHPRVPKAVRDEVSRWGMCRDEFADRGGWTPQLYVREARRMVGEYVMTEKNCRRQAVAPRPVALAAYQMDSHHVRRYVAADGRVRNEGDVEVGCNSGPFGIDYGAIVPKRGECANLLVPVCLSASHIAFGSIRMEPVFFALGQAAGTAACLSLAEGVAVQDVDYSRLRDRLLADGQRLAPPSAAHARDCQPDSHAHALTAASDELRRYWRLITGDSRKVPVRLRIDPAVSKSGNDAYSIVTRDGVAEISGSNARSVLYGVYDLLERRGGCGWFWDGDRLPRRETVDVSGLDVHEESKFAWRGIRYFAHRGLTRFQAEHWGLDDWKREIDWCLKKRLNLIMPRIGQDDLFQKAFPEACAYPDASKPLPGHGRGYDNRSLFWPLEFRGELRKAVLEYAFSRGMMVPTDFGTMTHWYSRTPQDFLENMKPDFLPQAPGAYGEPSGLVWDIRDRKWMDAYWRLTDTDIREYGRPGLLHTIGIAERRVSTNRAENLAMKTKLTKAMLAEAKRRHPESTRLLAGWDLYCMKTPGEVKAFLKNIPEDVVIWDYEADASINTWFGEWYIVGRRPYVFGVFMAYEAGLDARTDYAKIAARQRLVADDPMCRGYILWPESSHVDSIGLEWFAKNAWRADAPDVAPVVADYCARRYPDDAKAMEGLWLKTIPVSTNMQSVWRWNAFLPVLREIGRGLVGKGAKSRWPAAKGNGFFAGLPGVVKALKSLDWDKDELLKRDMMDIARVWADRLAVDAENAMVGEYFKWLDGDASAAARFDGLAETACARLDALARLLALHTDFSVCDSYDRLAKIHPIAYSGFSSVLVDNIANSYCASHQAELARHCYLPAFRHFIGLVKAKMSAGDRTPVARGALEEFRARAIAMPLSAMRIDAPRTREAFGQALDAVLAAAKGAVPVGGAAALCPPQRRIPEEWRDMLVQVRSSADGTMQPCWFWAPEKAKSEPVPLVVGLHTWSGDYTFTRSYAPSLRYAREHGWAMVGPNFRGPNSRPEACGSDLAVQDVVDAVEYAKSKVKIDPRRVYIIGGSGGGHMTLLMAGRHPEIWAGCAAFCPITDVARWHADSMLEHPGRGRNYAKMLEKACGGTPADRPDEYRRRSPLTWISRAAEAGVPCYIVTGIHDGWRGSVPVGHSFRAYNALADEGDRVPEAVIAEIEATRRVPGAYAYDGPADPFYGKKGNIHFRRTSRNVRFTLFEGGHGGNFAAGLDFLSRQVKGSRADFTIPAAGSGGETALDR